MNRTCRSVLLSRMGFVVTGVAIAGWLVGCDALDPREMDELEGELSTLQEVNAELEDRILELEEERDELESIAEADSGDPPSDAAEADDEVDEEVVELGRGQVDDDDSEEDEATGDDDPTLPDDVRQWKRRAKQIQGGHVHRHDSDLYILVSRGMESNPGHQVTIDEIDVDDDVVRVTASHERPTGADAEAHLINYPHAIEVVEGAGDASAEFEGTVSKIEYDGELPEIRAASDSLVLFEPGPQEQVSDEIVLRGIGRGLEGSIAYELWGTEKLSGHFFGAGALNWEPFEFTIEIPEEADDEHVLQLRLMDYGMKFTMAPTLVLNFMHQQ